MATPVRIDAVKRKVCIVFLVIFLLLAAFAGYKFFSAELDYRTASDYYDSLADTWVKSNISESVSAQDESRPAQSDSSLPQENAGRVSEESASPVQQLVPESGIISPVTEEKQSGTGSAAPESAESGIPAASHNAQYTASIIEKGRSTAEKPPISVDFDGLCRENPDIVGWIYCEDTPVNYPVLQGEDNKKYLSVQPDGRTSGSGSVFIDCNCDREFISDNTIMYGHNLKNKMFASLSRYSNQAYYDKHSVMWLLTPGENYKIELFAAFVIKDGGWIYVIDLPFPGDWDEFTESCRKASIIRPSFQPEQDDRLITLSTCDYSFDNARYVVVGSLVRSAK